jgi:hypothetical protein
MANPPDLGFQNILLHRFFYVNMDLTYRLDDRRTFFTMGPLPQLTSAAGTYASVCLLLE